MSKAPAGSLSLVVSQNTRSMIVHFHTEPGGKEMNEDFVIARCHPEAPDTWICILADGQGGRANGARASRTACESAWTQAVARPVHTLFEDGTWLKILRQADKDTALTGGFTTLIALSVRRDFAAGASCGDSKVYFKAPSQEDLHEWTEHQRKNPPVGSQAANFESFSYPAIEGGRILMASDGVWKYCGYEALRSSFLLPADSVTSSLRAAILNRGGSTLPDDFSIVAIDID
jgi:serine/threonine protein phosphatase PrpC